MTLRLGLAACLLMAGGCTVGWTGSQREPAPATHQLRSTFRVVQSSSLTLIPFDELVATASMADVVFVGEQHDDPETHFAEFALLEEIGRRRSRVVLSLEMFERDVQPMLDDYLAGRMSETEFLAKARPWDRYVTDYRPLVVLARARGWPVIASNIPRPIASAVSRQGLAVLDTLPAAPRSWVARDISCPHDAYYARFAEEMKGHSAGGGPPTASDPAQMQAMTDRFYEAQCVKDETMGESIARALARAGDDAIVVHVDGAFHSDFREGTVARTLRRSPTIHSLVITAIPTSDPSNASIDDNVRRADYLIFTRRSVP
jgi:uncharacterized iron-regulated protein